MSYNFASSGYKSKFGNLPDCDGKKLREDTASYMKDFDKQSWHDQPIYTIINGEYFKEGSTVDSFDAFGNVNGKQVLSPAHIVDLAIGHIHNYRPPVVDLRHKIRAMDLRFMTRLAPQIIGNQSMDFWKQDGITEIEESIQANRVEQRLNDALFAAEQEQGEIVIRREPVFVGCVSNFSNFLDLCRKCMRHLEVGVPVVVCSRSNTQQHMFRWTVMLVDMCKEFGIDPGMVTYLSSSRQERQRVFQQCRESPMHLTSSREVAKNIKEWLPKTMSSTGGPNTLVSTEFNDAIGQAVMMSNLIENKGQCTALRHFCCPNVSMDDVNSLYKDSKVVNNSLESVEGSEFCNVFPEQPSPLTGYTKVSTQEKVNCKIGEELPVGIEEQWRELYIDVTAPKIADMPKDKKFMADLAKWLNIEQPISLAMNAKKCEYDMATQLFETTGIVVYTVGSLEKPALTCQARPQDGECFGEFPPRHIQDETTHFPMIIPSPVAGYNSVYNEDFLAKKAVGGFELSNALCDEAFLTLTRIKGDRMRGYATVLCEYLVDAAVGPELRIANRTALFGLQRPPLNDSVSFLRCESFANVDRLLVFALPYMATNARDHVRISVSFDASSDQIAALIKGFGNANVHCNESHAAFEQRKAATYFYNSTNVDSALECCLAGQFVSRLFPFGHIKSTEPDDHQFADHFRQSRKWLRVTPPANQSNYVIE